MSMTLPKFTVKFVIDKQKFKEGSANSRKDVRQIAAKMAYEKIAPDQS